MRKVAVVTTGFFDGVHLGHRYVLETVVSLARERAEEAVVVTFWPHPRTVLQQDARDFRLLTGLEEKKELLVSCGINRVEVLPFTREFAALTAEQYLRLLRDRYNASTVVMGYDNRIGSDRKTAKEMMEQGFPNPSSLRSSSLPTSLRSVGPLIFEVGSAPLLSPCGSRPISPSDPASAGRSDERLLTSRTRVIPSEAKESQYWYFRVSADRFLRNMVRAIVGTLIEVGRGKHDPEWVKELIETGTRGDAGESVPGHALFLSKVKY